MTDSAPAPFPDPIPNSPPVGRPWLWWGCALLALPLTWFFVLVASSPRPSRNWESQAKLTVRALGSFQLAYRESVEGRSYGSWHDLRATGHLHERYTRSNMIDNYSLAVFYGAADRFVIVAKPRRVEKNRRMFSICEDQTVRFAPPEVRTITPQSGNDPPASFDPCTWPPLR